MHNTFLIARREYLERVRTRSFVIMTFLIPALMIGVTVLPTLLMTRGSNEAKRMVVVAADRDTAEMIRSRVEQQQDQSVVADNPRRRGLQPTHFTVEVSTNATPGTTRARCSKISGKSSDVDRSAPVSE